LAEKLYGATKHEIDKAFLIATPMIKADWTKRIRRGMGEARLNECFCGLAEGG
jgi:hypothetical protein